MILIFFWFDLVMIVLVVRANNCFVFIEIQCNCKIAQLKQWQKGNKKKRTNTVSKKLAKKCVCVRVCVCGCLGVWGDVWCVCVCVCVFGMLWLSCHMSARLKGIWLVRIPIPTSPHTHILALLTFLRIDWLGWKNYESNYLLCREKLLNWYIST